MGMRIAVLILGIAAVAYLGHSLWSRQHKEKSEKQFKKEWLENQASQEIFCDSCGETTTGLTLSRNEACLYKQCPECGEKTGRPVVYYMCMDPECNRQLIKVRNTVLKEGGVSSPGDPIICPSCGRRQNVTPTFLNLKSAAKYAKETDQEFP